MRKIVAAFASDEKGALIERHFGDAEYFSIYEIFPSDAVFVTDIQNPTAEEAVTHGNAGKAGGIAGLLMKNGVQAAVSKVFGPNIEKIKKHFVCVMVDGQTITDGIISVQGNFRAITRQWEKGETRDPVDLKKS